MNLWRDALSALTFFHAMALRIVPLYMSTGMQEVSLFNSSVSAVTLSIGEESSNYPP